MKQAHQIFARDSARPAQATGVGGAILAGVVRGIVRLVGWRFAGDWPAIDKLVVLAAPHTSNLDGFLMLAAAAHYRVKLSWMGKKSLAQGPFGPLLVWLGCVPVDRSAPSGLVAQMAEAFARQDRLILAVPPEGTRVAAPVWKEGYYRIAVAAGVPILFAVMDWKTRTITLSGLLHPSGDLAADWPLIRSHYESAEGCHKDQFILPP